MKRNVRAGLLLSEVSCVRAAVPKAGAGSQSCPWWSELILAASVTRLGMGFAGPGDSAPDGLVLPSPVPCGSPYPAPCQPQHSWNLSSSVCLGPQVTCEGG